MIAKALNRTGAAAAMWLCRYRGVGIVDALEVAVDKFHRKLDNVDFDMERNGEMRVLHALRVLDPRVVFDVGGHVGHWSTLVAGLYPECTIHAFEVVPATFARFVANTGAMPAIVANRVGLSDEAGEIAISVSPNTSDSTACKIPAMKIHDSYYDQVVQGRVIKGSTYVADRDIERIDLLKIDVEGMDLKVIRGFEDRLDAVRAIQFEYGIFNIGSHDLLGDFCSYLSDRGFVVGKIFPRHVAWFDYHFTKELFHGGNFLAVRAEQKELIATLGRSGAI
jgi:FkbM family methyltransferase